MVIDIYLAGSMGRQIRNPLNIELFSVRSRISVIEVDSHSREWLVATVQLRRDPDYLPLCDIVAGSLDRSHCQRCCSRGSYLSTGGLHVQRKVVEADVVAE